MSLDKAKVKKNLFEQTGPAVPAATAPAPVPAPAQAAGDPLRTPKFLTFEVKLSILLTAGQLEYIERLVHEIMRNRSVKKERITKNTVLRCLVDLLQALPLDTKDIADEDELRRRLLAAVRG
ncbi:hypothetical protein GX586_00365 [bacterium]|nr:hypothetical protein [bacterium]